MFRRSFSRLRWGLATGIAIVATTTILSPPAGALANPVRVHVYNRTHETLFLGGTDSTDKHYLGPGGSWSNVGYPDTKELAVNVAGFNKEKRYKACGELQFVNPALGYPYAELFKRAEDRDKGVADTFRFAVDESHDFHYNDSKLVVKRLADHTQKETDRVFLTTYKVFDLYIESCPD